MLALAPLAAEREHVLRDVHTFDVETGLEPRDEQAAGAARDIQGGLAALDEALEVVDLRPFGVELGPVAGDHPVVPGLRLSHRP